MRYRIVDALKDELEELNERLGGDDPSSEDATRALEIEGFLEEARDNDLIPESEWVEYAARCAYDSGMVEENSVISYYIDWERWADDLSIDYTVSEFDGETYYYREG